MQHPNEYILQFENVINSDLGSRTKQIHACWKIYNDQKYSLNSSRMSVSFKNSINYCHRLFLNIKASILMNARSTKRHFFLSKWFFPQDSIILLIVFPF